MAAFASSGVAASSVTRSAQRSAIMLQRLLPQAGEATLRLPCLQPGRLSYTTAPAGRRQLCNVVAATGRRDMSAHAAALEEELQVEDELDVESSLEAEFEAAARAKLDAQPASLSSLFEDDEVVEVDATIQDEALLLANCGLSEGTVKTLEKRGITALFPIQKHVFEPAMAGRDLIGRARTGSGKTLAFALPVIESLIKEDQEAGGAKARGRAPRCIILAPTRELAQQVQREFAEAAPTLSVGVFYGGAPIMNQKQQLRRGIDVAVGTPGRIIDLIENGGDLDLSKIRFAILDEADRMLSVGFDEDVERILENAPTERQTLLFSATMPTWVKRLTRKYQRSPVTVDLVGDEEAGKMAETIRLLAVQIHPDARRSVLVDLLTVYGAGGKCIVFANTKRDADEVSAAIANSMPTEALHGDIAQSSRERVLKRFREGKTLCLVATDVAARGLDIPNVDLVVHYELPNEVESFLHRSGRTGRANRAGTAVAMYTAREGRYLSRILKDTSITNCEMVSPPGPRQVMESSAKAVVGRLDMVDEAMLSFFQPAADKVMSSADPTKAMAAALAALSGIKEIPKPRSLLAQEEGHVTLRMMARPGRIRGVGSVFGVLRNALPGNAGDSVGKIRLLTGQPEGDGAAFDLPEAVAKQLLEAADELTARGITLDAPESLPAEQLVDDRYGSSPRGNRFGGGGGGRDRSYGGGGGGSRGGFGGGGRDRSYGGSRGGGGGSQSYGGNRGGSGGSYGGNRGGGGGSSGWGERRSGGGGGGRGGGSSGWGNRNGGSRSYGSSSYGAGGGRSARAPAAEPWDFSGAGKSSGKAAGGGGNFSEW